MLDAFTADDLEVSFGFLGRVLTLMNVSST